MNWGKALALSLAAFVALMAWFLWKASSHVESLVTDDYYAQELKYQDRIDAQARSSALSAPVAFTIADDRIQVRFPQELAVKGITGSLRLMRPNDARGDRSVEVRADSTGLFTSEALDLLPGRYDASLDWQADGVRYHSADKLVAQ